ncbi:hypothetical protein GF323_00080 [Candidatus Woesearchaeota archaeon]|nr:hypothetical protein [Candidatus Woesearchaeota archaeon]
MDDEHKITELANTLFSKGLAASMWDARNKAKDILGLSSAKIEQTKQVETKEESAVDNIMKDAGIRIDNVKKVEDEEIARIGQEFKESVSEQPASSVLDEQEDAHEKGAAPLENAAPRFQSDDAAVAGQERERETATGIPEDNAHGLSQQSESFDMDFDSTQEIDSRQQAAAKEQPAETESASEAGIREPVSQVFEQKEIKTGQPEQTEAGYTDKAENINTENINTENINNGDMVGDDMADTETAISETDESFEKRDSEAQDSEREEEPVQAENQNNATADEDKKPENAEDEGDYIYFGGGSNEEDDGMKKPDENVFSDVDRENNENRDYV